MEITIGWWAFPAVITAALWIWACTRKITPGGDYSFGNAIMAMVYGGTALLGTLLAWLIYFIALAVFA